MIWGNYDSLLLDLDGVVYEGAIAIEAAVSTINGFSAAGLPIGYVTNNSSRKPETIALQLEGFGISCEPQTVISSGQTGVELLAGKIAPGAKVLVVGGEGLRVRVIGAGFELVGSSDEKPAAVIQGFSPDVSWRDLAEAAYSIQNGAVWVATNSDWTIPQERGLAPGNGTLISAVHTAVGSLPDVAGKPEPAIFETAVRELDLSRPLFVGDRLDTDVLGANRAGIDSALVMTGVSTRKELLAAGADSRPKYILDTLADLKTPYHAPVATKRGYKCGKVSVELLGNKVLVVDGDPRSLDALKAATAVVWNSGYAIHALDVEAAIYD